MVFLIPLSILFDRLAFVLKGCIVVSEAFNFHDPIIVGKGTGVLLAIGLGVSDGESVVAAVMLTTKIVVVTTASASVCALHGTA